MFKVSIGAEWCVWGMFTESVFKEESNTNLSFPNKLN